MKNLIAGYDYGQVAQSPFTIQNFELLKKTVLFSAEDAKALQMAGEVLRDQTDEILDLWYGFVGSHEHLLHYFTHRGEPVGDYLTAARARFAQWILDLCNRHFDQDWLNY